MTIAGDDIISVIAAAKRGPGGDMMIFASPTLSHALSAAGLIDEWRLTWQPVILGGGLPLFGGKEPREKLELRSSVKNAGTGAFAFAAAAVVLVFSLTFGFLALAEGLITLGLWRWAGYLAVFRNGQCTDWAAQKRPDIV